MTIAQGAVLKCVVTLNLPVGVIAQNVFYYQVVGINPLFEDAALTTIATAMNAIYNTMDQQIVEAVSLETVMVHEWDYSAEEGWHTGTYIGEAALADTFAATGDMMPHAVAAIITGKSEDVNTRSRKSFAGFSENTTGQSNIAAGGVTALVAAAVEWLLTRTVVGSDALDPVIPALAGVIAHLIVALVSDIVGSQRQRKPGIGV